MKLFGFDRNFCDETGNFRDASREWCRPIRIGRIVALFPVRRRRKRRRMRTIRHEHGNSAGGGARSAGERRNQRDKKARRLARNGEGPCGSGCRTRRCKRRSSSRGPASPRLLWAGGREIRARQAETGHGDQGGPPRDGGRVGYQRDAALRADQAAVLGGAWSAGCEYSERGRRSRPIAAAWRPGGTSMSTTSTGAPGRDY
jgi:hypothetical protein